MLVNACVCKRTSRQGARLDATEAVRVDWIHSATGATPLQNVVAGGDEGFETLRERRVSGCLEPMADLFGAVRRPTAMRLKPPSPSGLYDGVRVKDEHDAE